MKRYCVYLASSSPRRHELLEQVNIDYTLITPDVDESHLSEVDPQAYTQRVAITKALFANQHIEQNNLAVRPIVAADTAVAIDNHILGKPDNAQHAYAMLRQLSGRTHKVFSSVTVLKADFNETVTQISSVTFRELTDKEIIDYWNSGEPTDKAGAYAIQGLAAQFVRHLDGSYSGVMGLPVFELFQILAKI